jgi:carbon monoxide dehydrogenase subunit G
MARIEGEIIIGRPVEEVFDFVADERNEPRYNPRMLRAEKISRGPIGAGTRFRAEMSGRRRPVAMTIEFTGYERPRRLSSTTRLSAMEIHGGLAFDPVPRGTRVRWEWNVEARGLLKLMSPVVAWIGRRQERTVWANLKRLLEAREASTSAGGGSLAPVDSADPLPRAPRRPP